MDKKRLLSLSTAGALTLSMLQSLSPFSASATLMPIKTYNAKLVLNPVAAEDLEHVKVSELTKMLVVQDYALAGENEEGNGFYSNDDLSYKDCGLTDIVNLPKDISFAWYDYDEDTYTVYKSTDEIDLSQFESTSSDGDNLRLLAGTAAQIDDEHNVWLDISVIRNVSQLPSASADLDLSAYSYKELKKFPVDYLLKFIKSSDKDVTLDISKATTVWDHSGKLGGDSYSFGKGETIDLTRIKDYDDYYDEDELSFSLIIGSGRYDIDTKETACPNTYISITPSYLNKLGYEPSLLTKQEDSSYKKAYDDMNQDTYGDSYYTKETVTRDADGNIGYYDGWDYDDDDNTVYYKYTDYKRYSTSSYRYFGQATQLDENYFSIDVGGESLAALKKKGINVDVYKYSDLKALTGDKPVTEIESIPVETKSVTADALSYYDNETDSQHKVNGVKVNLKSRSTDNVFVIVYSRTADDGKSNVVLSYDFAVVTGSISMIIDGNIDIKTADEKYEEATRDEDFYLSGDRFDAVSGEFSDADANDISYNAYLDENNKKFIDNDDYLVINDFKFAGHDPNEKNSVFDFTRYQYNNETEKNELVDTATPVVLKPFDSSWVNLYDDALKDKNFDLNDYKIVVKGKATKQNTALDSWGYDDDGNYHYRVFKAYQGNILDAGWSVDTTKWSDTQTEKSKAAYLTNTDRLILTIDTPSIEANSNIPMSSYEDEKIIDAVKGSKQNLNNNGFSISDVSLVCDGKTIYTFNDDELMYYDYDGKIVLNLYQAKYYYMYYELGENHLHEKWYSENTYKELMSIINDILPKTTNLTIKFKINYGSDFSINSAGLRWSGAYKTDDGKEYEWDFSSKGHADTYLDDFKPENGIYTISVPEKYYTYDNKYEDNELYLEGTAVEGEEYTWELDCEELGLKLNKEGGLGFNIQTDYDMELTSVQLVKVDKGYFYAQPVKVYEVTEGDFPKAEDIEKATNLKDVTDAILAKGDNKGYKLDAVKKDSDTYYMPCGTNGRSDYRDNVYKYFLLKFADGSVKNLYVDCGGYFSADADKTAPKVVLRYFSGSAYSDDEETATDSAKEYSYTVYDGSSTSFPITFKDNVEVVKASVIFDGKEKALDLTSKASNYDASDYDDEDYYYDYYNKTIYYETDVLAEGTHTIEVKAYDKAGNQASDKGIIKVVKTSEPVEIPDEPTDEPQVFVDIPIRTGIDPFFTATGVLYKNDKGEYVEANSDYETLSNKYRVIDSLGGIGYQTVLVKDKLTKAQMSQLKLIYDSADTVKNWEDDTLTKLKIYKENVLQKSGETVNDFSKGYVHYSAITDNEDKKAHVDKVRNYQVNVVTQQTGGAKLYVNGPDEREVMFNELYGYFHDVSVINTGDKNITGLKAELIDAKNVKLDKYWVVGGENNETLKPVFDNDGNAYVAKVRLLPDGDGEISGKLKISADGQEDKIITLKGRAGNPKITISEVEPAVKYVPYSNLIATNNMYDWVTVSFRLKPETKEVEDEDGDTITVTVPTDYKLPEGVTLNPENGELYGTPQKEGDYEFTVEAVFTVDPYYENYVSFKNSSVDIKLTVQPNNNDLVYTATDDEYPIKESVGTEQDKYDFVLDYEIAEDAVADAEHPLSNVDDLDDILFASMGEYADYKKFWFNGEELTDGEDYTSKSGSTEITIKSQTLKNKVRAGENTIAIEFRNKDGELKRTAQNFRVAVKNKAHTHDWSDWKVTTKPTTEKEGVETRTCKICGESETRAVAKHVHEWGEWVVTTKPTTEAEGVETRTCKTCGETETRAIAKLKPSSEPTTDPSNEPEKPGETGNNEGGSTQPAENNDIAIDILVYLVDGNNKPLADKLVEIHSDVYSAKTSSKGYAKYLGVESGDHKISVINDDGAVEAEKEFKIVKGDAIGISDDVITAKAGDEVMLTVKLDNGTLEFVSADMPETVNNDDLDIKKENETGDPNKAQESKNNDNKTDAKAENNNGSNGSSDVSGENNPTTGNTAPALGLGVMLIAVSLAVLNKKRK